MIPRGISFRCRVVSCEGKQCRISQTVRTGHGQFPFSEKGCPQGGVVILKDRRKPSLWIACDGFVYKDGLRPIFCVTTPAKGHPLQASLLFLFARHSKSKLFLCTRSFVKSKRRGNGAVARHCLRLVVLPCSCEAVSFSLVPALAGL